MRTPTHGRARRAAAQEVAFFDAAENASGALAARLAADTAAVRGAVGDQLGALTQSLVTFVAGGRLALCVHGPVRRPGACAAPGPTAAPLTPAPRETCCSSACVLYDVDVQCAAHADAASRGGQATRLPSRTAGSTRWSTAHVSACQRACADRHVLTWHRGGRAGYAIAFTYSWKLTLVISASVPLIALAALMQGRVMFGLNAQARTSGPHSRPARLPAPGWTAMPRTWPCQHKHGSSVHVAAPCMQ